MVREESRVTPKWLDEWQCHLPREGTEEVSDSLNLSFLWDIEMKMSSKQLDSQMLSFEKRSGIGNQSIKRIRLRKLLEGQKRAKERTALWQTSLFGRELFIVFVRFCVKPSYISKFNCTALKHYLCESQWLCFQIEMGVCSAVLYDFKASLHKQILPKMSQQPKEEKLVGRLSAVYSGTKCLLQMQWIWSPFVSPVLPTVFSWETENFLRRRMLAGLIRTLAIEKNA